MSASEEPEHITVVPETATQASPETEENKIDLAKARAEFQEKSRTYLLEQTKNVVIPSYSKWFNLDSIHSIEKKLFPDFFPAKSDTPSVYKTADSYKHIRDFIVNAYRINPIEYLTVTSVRRNLSGDVASIIRIHQFLEKWGIINYQIDPRTKSSVVGPQYTGHFHITLDTPKGLTPLIPELTEVTDTLPSPPASSAEPEEKVVTVKPEASIPLNLEIRRNIYNDASEDSDSVIQQFCSVTGENISDVRYHNLKLKAGGSASAASNISAKVFEQGLFPSNFVSSDFVKLEKEQDKDLWSEQEVLLLLEGVEMYASYDAQSQTLYANNNGQWEKISEHVGTKSREQCLVKFLQLPIEDRYMSKLINSDKKQESSIDKETVIQEVVEKLISNPKGQDVVKTNAIKNIQEASANQSTLINQVIELTLEKVLTKLNAVTNLEANLIKTENLLNLQRKQLLIERWLNFDKIQKFKQQNTNPELNSLLDDLLTPVSISEVNKTFNKINLDGKQENEMEVDTQVAKEADDESLPISVTQPKSYQFWSA